MIDLADRLALLESGVSKQLLVNSARHQWHLPAAFVWKDSFSGYKGQYNCFAMSPIVPIIMGQGTLTDTFLVPV